MGFKENLLKKMEIDRTAVRIAASMGPPGSGRRIDKALARGLLAEARGEKMIERDLELYRLAPREGQARILVLDNDLPIYATTPADVVLRKSPTVKEMLNVRNVFKILNDADVLVSKKEASIQSLREEALAGLDLHFEAADIEGIYNDGRASLESHYAAGIEETLQIFAELLGYGPPPAALRRDHCLIIGRPSTPPGETFGPSVLFDRMHFALRLIEAAVLLKEAAAVTRYQKTAAGEVGADATGAEALAYLRDAVMQGVKS